MKNEGEVSKLKSFLFVLLMICIGIYCIVSGIWGLTGNTKSLDQVFTQPVQKGDLFEGSVAAASPLLFEIDHKINYIIPSGKEYYYLILSEDRSTAITIRADKNFGKLFDDNWECKEKVVIKGSIKRLYHKANSGLDEVEDTFIANGKNFVGQYYIDTISGRLYIMRIILGVCLLLLIFLSWIIIRRNKVNFNINKILGWIILITIIICFIAVVILSLYLLAMH